MKLARMALRNIFRQKRRTLVTLSALVIGLSGLVVFQGFIGELMRGFRDSVIRGGIGHLQVAGGAEYFEDGEFNPYAYPVKDGEELMTKLRGQAAVEAVFPSTGFTSVAGIGDKSATLLVKGYPAERMYFAPAAAPGGAAVVAPSDKFSLGTLVAGSPLGVEDRDKIVLGETVARILKVGVGEVITLMAILPNGGLNGRDFTVAGIYESPGRDKMFAFTDYSTAADFTGLEGPPVFHVLVKDIGQVGVVAAMLPKATAYRTWHDLATLYVQVNAFFLSFQGVIRTIILLMTLFILGNTMNRIVFERMREWGTLRAMGTKKGDILLLVVLEGCFLGAAGAALGIALGFGASALLNLAGGLPYKSGVETYVAKIKPGSAALWLNLIPVVVTAGIAAYFPGRRAVKLTPSECLRQI